MQISNKEKKSKTGEWAKHPRPFLKRLGNKKIRKEEIVVEEISAGKKGKVQKSKIKNKRLCPFCFDDIPNQYKDQKAKHLGACKKCGAVKSVVYGCPHCKSARIWKKGHALVCKVCEKRFDARKME